MNPFDYKKAWEKRFDVDIAEGVEIIVDNKREYKVVKVIMPKNREENSPHYILTPIGENLKEHQRSHDTSAKKNPWTMTVGKYPDFSFEIESMWFFSRDVKIK
jgi:hypothetical protein